MSEQDGSTELNDTSRFAIGTNGRPMVVVKAAVGDKVPTVKYGDVYLGVTMTRVIDDLGDTDEARQYRIDQARLLQRDAQYVVGVERRLLQWALNPESRVESPIDGAFQASSAGEAFNSPPAGYDPSIAADLRGQTPPPPPPPPPPVPAPASAEPPQKSGATPG